jgi:hypothetical protein
MAEPGDVPVADGYDPYAGQPMPQQPQQTAGGGFFDALRGLFGGNRQPQAQPVQARPAAPAAGMQRQGRPIRGDTR